MKQKLFYLILLAITLTSYACSRDDFEYEGRFKESKKALADFKTRSGNSYKYVVSGYSWIGISWETTITVLNGKVVQRYFKYTEIRENMKESFTQELEWTEGENELNTHTDPSAAAVMTLDEVYDKAQQDWLLKRADTETFFETKNNGLISSCGYVHKDCADDCFRGITIKSIDAAIVD